MQDHKSFCELLILATELESRAWLLIWLDLLGGKTGPSLLPSSVKHSSDWLRFDNFCRIPASQSPGVFFFPIVEKSHLVSYPHDGSLSWVYPLFMRSSIIWSQLQIIWAENQLDCSPMLLALR